MTSNDPSLDTRIWAYVRGEGSLAERKKLEEEVGSSPSAARRYASIKLTFQRELARNRNDSKESMPSPEKASFKPHANSLTKPYFGRAELLMFALSAMLLAAACGLYFAGFNGSPSAMMALRDGLHISAALLTGAIALCARSGRVETLALSVGCIAASCAFATMLVK